MSFKLPNGQMLTWDKPRIMGILNVTPDSFSDGGQYATCDQGVAHAMQMLAQGADVIDIGGESSRPGAKRVEASEQIARTCEIIEKLVAQFPNVIISIDTTHAAVALAAIKAGACMINDISAGTHDPDILDVAFQNKVPIILMHMQGDPTTMQQNPCYENVVQEVLSFLITQAKKAEDVGIAKDQIMIDPGIGFGKTREHNLALMNKLTYFFKSGYATLLGTSRKRFMGSICTSHAGVVPLPSELLGATCATTSLGVQAGVQMFRVHDVRANRQAADVTYAIK